VVDDILVRYPQLELYLKNKHLRDVKDLMKDPEGKDIKEVDIEGFKLALAQVDSQAKSLPATAQVFFLHLLLYVLMPVLFFFFLSSKYDTRISLHTFFFRLLLNKVLIFLGVSIVENTAKIILKVLGVL
jgi:hypothetical protein